MEVTSVHPLYTNLKNHCPVCTPKQPDVNSVDSPHPPPDPVVLTAIKLPGEAFRKARGGVPPVKTCFCPKCKVEFAHNELLFKRVYDEIKRLNISITEEEIDFFRCTPPSATYPDQDSEDKTVQKEALLQALIDLDYQFHLASHCSSCFKKVKSTPKGLVCRFNQPHKPQEKLIPETGEFIPQESYIDLKTGEFIPARAIGSEYYTLCSHLLSSLIKDNMDLKFIMNSTGKKTTVYCTKYSFKPQQLESSMIMRIGLISKAFNKVLDQDNNAELTTEERGKRMLNKLLYATSFPIEFPTTLSAFSIINKDSLFLMSHDFVYCNLNACVACFKNCGEIDSDEEAFDDDLDGDFDESAWVDIQIPRSALVIPESNTQKPVDEVETYVNIKKMEDYWFRPDSMKKFNFIYVLENYHLVDGKGNSTTKMQIGHTNPDKHHWVENPLFATSCIVVTGRQMPNLERKNPLLPHDSEFYYKLLLCLFKPSGGSDDLLRGKIKYCFISIVIIKSTVVFLTVVFLILFSI